MLIFSLGFDVINLHWHVGEKSVISLLHVNLFLMYDIAGLQASPNRLNAYETRAQLSLGLADRTHGAHSQPASIIVRV